MSNYVLAPNPLGFQFDHSDLSRFRNGAHGRCGVDVDVDMDVDGDDGGEEGDGKPMTISEAVWRRWEQVGELAKGAGELFSHTSSHCSFSSKDDDSCPNIPSDRRTLAVA